MTTYINTLELNDSEWIALQELIVHIRDREGRGRFGQRADQEALKRQAEMIAEAMRKSKRTMTSTSSSCWPGGVIPPEVFAGFGKEKSDET
ncbi:MAG: hypothetical protein VXW22_02300 [Pseudomonadota bacterium]|nr:hypothetical protein [Pseudomonadota bacterium]